MTGSLVLPDRIGFAFFGDERRCLVGAVRRVSSLAKEKFFSGPNARMAVALGESIDSQLVVMPSSVPIELWLEDSNGEMAHYLSMVEAILKERDLLRDLPASDHGVAVLTGAFWIAESGVLPRADYTQLSTMQRQFAHDLLVAALRFFRESTATQEKTGIEA